MLPAKRLEDVVTYLAKSSIEFADILVIRAIIVYNTQEGKPPSTSTIISQVNQYIDEQKIGIGHTRKISGTGEFWRRVKKLRKTKLMTPSNGYVVLDAGIDLLDHVGEDWRKWPIAIPFTENGTLQFDKEK